MICRRIIYKGILRHHHLCRHTVGHHLLQQYRVGLHIQLAKIEVLALADGQVACDGLIAYIRNLDDISSGLLNVHGEVAIYIAHRAADIRRILSIQQLHRSLYHGLLRLLVLQSAVDALRAGGILRLHGRGSSTAIRRRRRVSRAVRRIGSNRNNSSGNKSNNDRVKAL